MGAGAGAHESEEGAATQARLRALAEAGARARSARAPVLLEAWEELAQGDFAARLVPHACAAKSALVWADPSRDHALVALGSTQTVTADGASRFAVAREFCSRAAEQSLQMAWRRPAGLAEQPPLVFGGFAFEDASPRPSPWQRWQGARWQVPAVVFERRDGSWRVSVYRWVSGGESAAELLTAVQGELDAARALLDGAPPSPGTLAPPPFEPIERRAAWEQRVRDATSAVTRGELSKVVLARAARARVDAGARMDPAGSWLRLRESQPLSIAFLVAHDGEVFLGATPEVLLRATGSTLETHALAGTAPRIADRSEDARNAASLLASFKDRGEHDVVVATLRADLSSCCDVLEPAGAARLLTLPNVYHLETTLRGKLREGIHPFEVASRLHPTASLGGAPGPAARAYLKTHETLERGWYAGAVGWCRGGDAVLAVAIRSALVATREAWAFTGAGIVATSDPAAEWRETEAKLAVIRGALTVRVEER